MPPEQNAAAGSGSTMLHWAQSWGRGGREASWRLLLLFHGFLEEHNAGPAHDCPLLYHTCEGKAQGCNVEGRALSW